MKKYITLFAIIILFSGCSSIGNNFIGDWVVAEKPDCSVKISKQDKNYILQHTNLPCGSCLPSDGIYNLDENGNLINGPYKLAYIKGNDNIIMSGAPYPLKRIKK